MAISLGSMFAREAAVVKKPSKASEPMPTSSSDLRSSPAQTGSPQSPVLSAKVHITTPIPQKLAVGATSNSDPVSAVHIATPTPTSNSHGVESQVSKAVPSKSSSETSASAGLHDAHRHVDHTVDFAGDVDTDNKLPSQETLKKVGDFAILDQDGKSLPFKSLYSGPNVARRVLVIFIRHFFCGNCQEYIRTLTTSITPSSLLALPTPTSIAIIGCGSPTLISMYATATSCPFPVYADPTKRLYSELGMLRTLNLGHHRPEYQRKGQLAMAVQSVVQGVRELGKGKAFRGGVWRGGDMQQVGGEFLFEPVDWSASPIVAADSPPQKDGTGNANGYFQPGLREELKRVTWCHRMRNTRDHAEIPEMMEVLGLDVEVVSDVGNQKRWSRALGERKGTGLNGRTSKSLSPGRNSHGSGKREMASS